MFTCPDCAQGLTQKKSDFGVFWACESCHRRLISIPILRRTLEETFFTRLWQEVRKAGEGDGPPCLSCSKPMNRLTLGTAETPLEPLVCKACNFAWVTQEQRAHFPVKPPPPPAPDKVLPAEAAKMAALLQVQMIADRAKEENRYDASRIPVWQKALSVVGMPLEGDFQKQDLVPWNTFALSALILAVSVLFLLGPAPLKSCPLALIPARTGRYGGLPFLFNFLAHSGWFDLATNLYFLFLFGRSVEGEVHWQGFWALFILSSLGGNLAALAFAPKGHDPVMGAGAGVAGVMLFYGFVFPTRNLLFYFHGRFLPIPVWAALGLWCLIQVIGFYALPSGMGGVSFATNLGGLSAGLLCWSIWRFKKGKTGPEPASKNPDDRPI